MNTKESLHVKLSAVHKQERTYTVDECSDQNFNGGFMHVIHMLYIETQKYLESALSSHNQISFSQFLILAGFSSQKNVRITQVKLAERLLLTEATISRHIRTLVDKKLLQKEKDLYNKKIYNISLTNEGLREYTNAKTTIMNELNILFSHISEKDKQIIVSNFTSTLDTLQKKK